MSWAYPPTIVLAITTFFAAVGALRDPSVVFRWGASSWYMLAGLSLATLIGFAADLWFPLDKPTRELRKDS